MGKRILGIRFIVLILLLSASVVLTNCSGGDDAPETTSNTTESVEDTQTDAEIASVSIEPGLISPADYQSSFSQPGDDHFLLDVRTPEEFAAGHIEGAINISIQELQAGSGFDRIPTDQTIVLYCRSGNRSASAQQILESRGYDGIYDIAGGTNAWSRANLPLVTN